MTPFRRALPALFVLSLVSGACARGAPPAPAGPTPDTAARPPVDNRRVVRLGVILPERGILRQYADAVLQGVQVAVDERKADARFRIEHVVREATGTAGVAAAVRSLAAEGVVAIVAPLPDAELEAAASARADSSLAIISPTAARPFRARPQVYALNVPDTLGAAALGAYAARNGLEPAAVLRARSGPAQLQARAFVAAYVAAGGRTPVDVAYDVGTTTFASALRRVRDAKVRALFVAGEEREVRQILPQVRYYGLSSVQVLSTGAWGTPEGIARIGLGTLEGAIVTTPFLRDEPEGEWQRFVAAYEAHFRRSLDNPIPALGYDAARLALAGLDARGSAAGVAAALRQGEEVTGATGRLRSAPGSVFRIPRLVRVRAGRLLPITTDER